MKGSTKFWISCAILAVGYFVYHTTLNWPTFSEDDKMHIYHMLYLISVIYLGVTTAGVLIAWQYDEYESAWLFWPPYWVYFVLAQINRLLDKIFD
jgi:hypothetical protein